MTYASTTAVTARPRADLWTRKLAEAKRLTALDHDGRDAYRRLAELRARLAREVGMPAYQVFNNDSLLELAARRPTDAAALADIPGMNALRTRAFGEEVLALLRGAAAEAFEERLDDREGDDEEDGGRPGS